MNLSKSKILAFRQCPKRLWLEVKKPELLKVSTATSAKFNVGFKVGEIAQSLYDPENKGTLIDIKKEGISQALARSQRIIDSEVPIFEAGFSANGVLAFADVMLPAEVDGKRLWDMVEVKSSTSVKDYHRDDIAIQSYVAQLSGFKLNSVSIAHVDSKWVYPGDEQYHGLLKANDLTTQALSRTEEVQLWVQQAQQILAGKEPNIDVGDQCSKPFECGFYAHCTRDQVKPEYPLTWLPRLSSKKMKALTEQGINDLRDVADGMLNKIQLRVKKHTLLKQAFFDQKAAQNALSKLALPAYFLDFETIMFAVPIWKGTRPYQQIPFQFSMHMLNERNELNHIEFLDLSRNDPSKSFAETLVASCGKIGPVFVYNAGFENSRIRELAKRFPVLSDDLLAITKRVVDLLPIARDHYYHPSQHGSWSIKKVLPALVPELNYANLQGVQDGGMAMNTFLEAIHSSTSNARKSEIEQQLLEYCKLDTYAMVKLWQVFSGRNNLVL